jgi:conjugal transfer pilus assembly protein TraL
MVERTLIPRGIDDAPQILFWTIDEMAPAFLGLIVGIALGQLLLCTAIGFGAIRLYRKYRDSRPDGYLLHASYWIGFMPCRNRAFVNPFSRRFLP